MAKAKYKTASGSGSAGTLRAHSERLRGTMTKRRGAGDEDWLEALRDSLQMAVTLEFATVPPYLSALWSIKHELDPVAVSIREIVQQEMLHMGLAANMLASIGGVPKITAAVPAYPTGLPGGVHEGLTVKLAGLSKAILEDFMWIERPVETIPDTSPHHAEEGGVVPDRPGDETIGEFYDCIKAAFIRHQPKMSLDHQITGPLAWKAVATVEDVEDAIELIQTQGEGSSTKPVNDRGSLSHYYRFQEAYEGYQLIWKPAKKVLEHGDPIPFPEVWPMAPVPEGGYQEAAVSAEVWHLVDKFDDTFTLLLNQIQKAWTEPGGQAYFIRAIATMFELERYAKPLMRIPIPKEKQGRTYGPCFRYKGE